jgi:hypothetical protein
MATIDDVQTVKDIIAGKYDDDSILANRITYYDNMFGGHSFGVDFGTENRYTGAEGAIFNPRVVWERDRGVLIDLDTL